MAQERATITSIADELNLSPSTVSYVLRGNAKKIGISSKTAERVREIAKKLGYVPNNSARSLQGQKTGHISVLFSSLKAGWSDSVMQGIEEVLDVRHYFPLIVRHSAKAISSDTYFSGGTQAAAIIKRGDDGVICQPHQQFIEDYKGLMNAGVPVVLIGSLLNDMTGIEKASFVIWDCDMAVKHKKLK